jgi:predicted O-methyltransferase YrrM
MEHFYDNIPGWAAFKGLYRAVVIDAPSDRECLFVEVGSWQGKSAAYMAVEIINSGKRISLACVDPWQDGGPDLRDTNYFKSLQKPLYDIFLHNIKPVAHLIRPYRMTSVEAASQFEDKSIDFIMLDGDHNYPAVLEDIRAWLPKMRPGGLMAGDDYRWPGVTQSVTEAFGDKATVVDIRKDARDYKLSSSYWSIRIP